MERDVRGKQVRKCTTWTPPEGLTPAKAKKAAERAADAWEQEIKAENQKEKELGNAYRLPLEKRHDDFAAFVKNADQLRLETPRKSNKEHAALLF